MDIERAKAKYNNKTSRYFTPTETVAYIPEMQSNWITAMTALSSYQDIALGLLNDAGVPGARRASFIAFVNAMFQMCITKLTAGMAAEKEGLALVEYMTIIFAWTSGDRIIAVDIAANCYSVAITLPVS